MSLTSRLTDLVAAIGADVKQLLQASNLPSYAPKTSKNSYDPKLNIYNLKGSNTRAAHAGIVRALNGGKMNILAFGDSTGIGYNGTDAKEWRSIPRMVGRYLAQSLGVSEAGGMVPICVANSMVPSDKVAYTGSVIIGNGAIAAYTGATITIQPKQAATQMDFFYSDLSVPFTIAIDGGAPVTVTPGNTSAMKKWSSGVLADGLHTMVVTVQGSANYLFTPQFGTTRAAGIAVHNLHWGGSRLSQGGPGVAWLDTSAAANLIAYRKNSFDLLGVAPDLVMCILGGNDIPNGDTGDNFAAQMATARAWYPNATFLFVLTMGLTTTTQANWDAFCGRMYKMCDDLDIVMLDLRDRAGWATEANAAGLIGADGYHEVAGAMFDWARVIANALTGSGPGSFYAAPAGSYVVADQPDGIVIGEF